MRHTAEATPAKLEIKVEAIAWVNANGTPVVVVSSGGREYTLSPGDTLTFPIPVAVT